MRPEDTFETPKHGAEIPDITRAKVAEIVEQRVACKEHFIARYLDATGHNIEECVLVEHQGFCRENMSYRTEWWIEHRPKT